MKKVKLGEVCEILSGYAFKSSQFNDKKIGLPLIRIRDVERGFSDTYFEGAYPEEYLIKNGDLLITMDGSFILKKWEGDLALLNQRVCKIKITDKSVDEDYISWLIPKYLKEIEDKTPFVTVKHLSVAKIKDISFVLPNKPEQKLISKELNTISQIYDFRKIQSEGLNELVKSRFNEMFGDPISNSLKLPIKKFEKVVTLQRGFDLPIQNRQVGEINVWGSNGIVATHTESKVTEQGIVTGRSGSIGKVYVTEKEYWPLNTTLFSKELHGNNPIFLKYLLEAFKLERFNNGTGVPTLNRNIVHKEDIIYVPLSLQDEFADFVAQVDKSQFACQKAIKLWRNSLKSSII